MVRFTGKAPGALKLGERQVASMRPRPLAAEKMKWLAETYGIDLLQ